MDNLVYNVQTIIIPIKVPAMLIFLVAKNINLEISATNVKTTILWLTICAVTITVWLNFSKDRNHHQFPQLFLPILKLLVRSSHILATNTSKNKKCIISLKFRQEIILMLGGLFFYMNFIIKIGLKDGEPLQMSPKTKNRKR